MVLNTVGRYELVRSSGGSGEASRKGRFHTASSPSILNGKISQAIRKPLEEAKAY
jgi:hypothetical protein